MKRRMTRVAAVLMSVAMTASLFGCGGKEAGSQSAEGKYGEPIKELTLPLTDEKAELTVWVQYNGTNVKDLNEVESVKKMEELTGVHINWIPVNQDDMQQKYGTLVASGDLPDIIYAGSIEYPGGFETGVEDGVIHPDMDALIRTYMPNYMALLESSDEAMREAKSDSGKFVVAKNIVGTFDTVQSEGTYNGLAYRQDLLEKLGMDVPTTIDGWHDVLVAAKKAGIQNPFVLDQNGGSSIALSWGVGTESQNYMQLDGDKVVLSQSLDGYEGYLKTMRQWYSEGLINPNFTTFHFYLDTPASVNNNEGMLYSMVLSGLSGNNYARFHMIENQDAFLQPIVAPALKEGDEPIQAFARQIAKDPVYITASCKNPELAAKWLDFQYSEQGILLNWYGIEGKTYDMVEGKPVFKEEIYNQGMSAADYLASFALNEGQCWLGKHDISANWQMTAAQAGGENQELAAVEVWSAPKTNVFLPMQITLTDDESSAVTNTLTALKTMIDEYTIGYITGQTDKDFKTFRQELEDAGMQEVVDTYQAAYDRFLER
ncbi:MAG: extracellular solute-binding protein [Agathobacter sp.]|uniref:extracellular solute-binding protein n=1 Tax=Agathobacter sp. TaxID=2021311 RepID=UPI002587A194|nr:extracellular solute-binding protein [Agathobacter sp.]MCR5676421.1 extracellular solute-binding protein [Agathobacter sp.]